jgi:hypothetical protein
MNPIQTPGAASAPSAPSPAWQRERWERIALGIRLAYNPFHPQVVAYWVALGRRLADSRVLDEERMLMRTLQLLLQTSQDSALPWFWRSVCLEHSTRPLARLQTLVQAADPVRAQALEAFVQAARDRLGAVPGCLRQRAGEA